MRICKSCERCQHVEARAISGFATAACNHVSLVLLCYSIIEMWAGSARFPIPTCRVKGVKTRKISLIRGWRLLIKTSSSFDKRRIYDCE